jgi:hypothetical protein
MEVLFKGHFGPKELEFSGKCMEEVALGGGGVGGGWSEWQKNNSLSSNYFGNKQLNFSHHVSP